MQETFFLLKKTFKPIKLTRIPMRKSGLKDKIVKMKNRKIMKTKSHIFISKGLTTNSETFLG